MGSLGRGCRPRCCRSLTGRSWWHLLSRLGCPHIRKGACRFCSGVVESRSIPRLRRPPGECIELFGATRALSFGGLRSCALVIRLWRRRKWKLWCCCWSGGCGSGESVRISIVAGGSRCIYRSYSGSSSIVFSLLNRIAQDLMGCLHSLELRNNLDFMARISVWVVLFCCDSQRPRPTGYQQPRIPKYLNCFLMSSVSAVGGKSRSA